MLGPNLLLTLQTVRVTLQEEEEHRIRALRHSEDAESQLLQARSDSRAEEERLQNLLREVKHALLVASCKLRLDLSNVHC